MKNPQNLQSALARISSYFMGDFLFEEGVSKSFTELASITGADRIYLYRIHHKAKLAHVTHEWINPSVNGLTGTTTSFSLETFSWLISNLQKRDEFQFQDIRKLPPEAEYEKKSLLDQKVSSFVIYPLRISGKLEGLIGFDFLEGSDFPGREQLDLLKIATDIIGISVERKIQETSLKKSEKLYKNIFENTGAATVTILPDTGITMVNTEFENLTGYSRKMVVGKMRLTDFVSEKDHQLLRRHHYLMMSNPGAVFKKYEFDFTTRKGDKRNAFMTGSSILDTKNCLISFIDITDFKINEKELISAKDKAEDSDRLKSAFLANVSHEIRTPLNAITGFSALLSNPNLHLDKKDKYIKQILNGSNELVNLIDNVLDISRIESGTLQPGFSEFLLDSTLEEILDFYRDFKTQHNKEHLDIRLKLPLNESKILIHTDKMRFQQILSNLLENAIKFTSSGSIEFGYSVIRDSEQPNILFYVKDTGIGIAKNNIDKIFGRFIKIVNKEDNLYRGAGLGLALVKDLVQLLDGDIWLDSNLRKGSTFYFTLPYNEPSESAAIITDADSTDWSGKTILVAEDTESNYLYIEEILGPTKAKLIRASDGAEAIDLFNKYRNEINLVFMDILMPEYDGFEAASEIRKIKQDIPVIAQTAFTFEGELTNGLYAGCFNDYILKPFNIKTIQELLSRYLFP